MKVADLMTKDVRTCTPEDSLSHAARLMWEGDFGALPVVNPRGQVIGMVTDRDTVSYTHLTLPTSDLV